MRATETKLLDFLRKAPQFIIPIYQRTYSWAEPECLQLWDDILHVGRDDDIAAHFSGSIVYIEESAYGVTNQPPLLVIDGQQRLTTVSLIIEVLARKLGNTELIDGFSADKLRNYYLFNPYENGERRYKLLLTQTDKQTLLSIIDREKPMPKDYSLRIKENFDFFENKINKLGDNLEPLCKGLVKLMIVEIALSRDNDNPQRIFESMNSTGRELSQADLIRNFILMDLEPSHQTQLYNNHWRPMEITFGQEAYGQHFDSFMRHYLTTKTGEIPKVSEVYEAFKGHAPNNPPGSTDSVDELVADLHTFADYYCAMALDKESNTSLAGAFHDLRELKVDVAYPFLLELYHDYTKNLLSAEDLEQVVRLVESYVFRRAICTIPTNSLNKTFATFGRALQKEHYLESIRAHFLLLRSYRRFPNDDEFRREIQVRDLYNFRSRSYWLRRFENHKRKEWVPIDEYTIEHILPQNENLSQEWQDALGSEWRRIQETWLHTLGNLTLTGYNSEYGDKFFTEKRDMEGGFKKSPLQVNQGLGEFETWDEDAIKKRSEQLALEAIEVWRAPVLTTEVIERYRPKAVKTDPYTIEDHPHLASDAPMRLLFNKLRTAILELNPCVNEEFLKLYVAYKAETNFVDVIPQAKRLRLILNMEFHEIYDPRELARDITNLGQWGNGDVELGLSSSDELPYVMGLVRQAFEKQMGNGAG